MPNEIGGRPLWNTPPACIYARDKGVAGETELLVRQLSDELNSQYHRTLGRGVVIVVDVDDPAPLVETMLEAQRLDQQSSVTKRDRKAASQPTTGPSEDERNEMEKLGITESMICRLIVARLDVPARKRFNLEEDRCPDVNWVLCCPSRRQTRVGFQKVTDAAIAHEGGIAAKLLVAPWMPLILNEAVKRMNAGIKLVIVEDWVEEQSDWSRERRKEVLQEMAKRLGIYDEFEIEEPSSQPARPDSKSN